jgi:hypothetical protein
MAESKDQPWKTAEGAPEALEDLVRSSAQPIGLDVGTSKVVAARRGGRDVACTFQLNAFIPVPYSPVTERTIQQQADIHHFRDGEDILIFGSAAERFANMFNAEARRPMADGLINPKEKQAWPVLERILRSLVPKPQSPNEVLAFSVPAAAPGRESALTYHEATLRKFLQSMGYRATAINEGLAVVFSELEDHNFTGIGVSCGGGMCNATLAFLSIPSIMVSASKAGDWIDRSAGEAVGEHATRVKAIKEESLDLTRAPRDKLEKALHIYYEDVVETLVDTLRRAISREESLPKTDRALPLVLAGGSAKPRGFRDLFERTLRSRPFPVVVSEIRMAAEPIIATARGAHIAAMFEK